MRISLSLFVMSGTLAALSVAAAWAQQGVTEYGPKPGLTKNATAAVQSDLAPYLAALERKIGDRGPKKFIGQVAINFTLDKSGSVTNTKLAKSSGMPQIDSAAMTAIKTSAPFDPLPSGAGKTVDVQVSFEGTSQTSTCHAIRTH
jgi:TonB family protein